MHDNEDEMNWDCGGERSLNLKGFKEANLLNLLLKLDIWGFEFRERFSGG